MTECPLCQPSAEEKTLWQNAFCRVILVDEPHYPGYCRIIWRDHVREMTDLAKDQQIWLMQIVLAVEGVVRQAVKPDKVNLASLGNVVPHLHWHVVPRWQDDPHFPQPVWGPAQREGGVVPLLDVQALKAALQEALDAVCLS